MRNWASASIWAINLINFILIDEHIGNSSGNGEFSTRLRTFKIATNNINLQEHKNQVLRN